jgi:transaldolase / glucose-6-phosphate isomerase
MNPLRRLNEVGQVVWLDFLSRRFIVDGSLKRLIDNDGLAGVTSNPSIFEKAIVGSNDYDAALQAADRGGYLDERALFEQLAVEDIRAAADVLRPVYDATRHHDGYVSIEVSPYLAMSTDETVAEARRLWHACACKNLMIKVPATTPGLAAVRQLTSEGINVNITLLFSRKAYEQVAQAYLRGLEDLISRSGDLDGVTSVASFFVSRIDTAVDTLITTRLNQTNDDCERAVLKSILGKVAIANAKLAYQRYKRLFAGPRWEALRAKGAHPQRLLWASVGTKNPGYRDVLYIEELIGPHTVTTIPRATMDHFRDHGKVRPSLEEDVPAAQRVMATLEDLGISIDEVTSKVLEESLRLFANAMDALLCAIASKRTSGLLGNDVPMPFSSGRRSIK